MKIAIATFGERVSPRFDCAPTFTTVTIDDGQFSKGQPLSTSEWAPHDRINKLVELGIDTIVCGGIDWWSAESLRSAGIKIYSQVTGEIDEALAALVRGDLHAESVTLDVRDQADGVSDHGDRHRQDRQRRQESRRGGGRGRGRWGGHGGCGRGDSRA